MKKYLYLFLTMICAAGFVACSDDDDDVEGASLRIVSSNVLFQAAPGTGTVEFYANGTVTAETDREWCTASISGNTVHVAVTENGSLEGRSSLLTLRCGADSVNVTVQQTGLVFQVSAGSSITTDSDEAHTLTYTMNTNVNLTFEADADWFSAAINGDELQITFTENTTGHIRMGTLQYHSETFADAIKVVQYDFDKDIAGTCYFVGYSSSGSFQYLNAVLSRTEITLPDYEWTFPVTFDEERMSFNMPNASLMGTYSSYYVYNIVVGNTYMSYSTSISVDGKVEYDADEQLTYIDFVDNGSWSSDTVQGMYLYAFKAASPTSANRYGLLMLFYNPSIWRFDPE